MHVDPLRPFEPGGPEGAYLGRSRVLMFPQKARQCCVGGDPTGRVSSIHDRTTERGGRDDRVLRPRHVGGSRQAPSTTRPSSRPFEWPRPQLTQVTNAATVGTRPTPSRPPHSRRSSGAQARAVVWHPGREGREAPSDGPEPERSPHVNLPGTVRRATRQNEPTVRASPRLSVEARCPVRLGTCLSSGLRFLSGGTDRDRMSE